MKNNKFLEEQEKFEGVRFSNEEKEWHNLIFKELSESSKIEVPESFSNRVVANKIRKENLWQDVKFYAFYAIMAIVLVSFGVFFISLDTSQSGKELSMLLSSNLTYVILASFGYFIIQTLDRLFINKTNIGL